MLGGEQPEYKEDGVNGPPTLASTGLLPWSDIKVTETPGGLSPEFEQQRRIQRLREISKREKFAPSLINIDTSKQLCDKCRMVPWDQLAATQLPGPAGVRVLYEIHETREMLLASQCLVCKFIGSIWPEGVLLDRCFLGMRCLCNMLPKQATSRHHSPGYEHSPQFQLSGHVKNTQVWSSENFGILHPWSRHDELAPRRVDTDRINIELVRQWLETCKSSHKHDFAGPRGKERVPGFKVIDCQTKRVVPVAHEICRYVALSYVWGEPSEEPQTEQYPKTIRDAIIVCEMLGYQYLWVDRYCINQDNEEEKSIQINMMDCIYSQAELTIVATDPGPTKGLPGAASRPRKKQQSCDLGCVELIKTYHTDEAISRSTWATRGWTFQEGYLSRRKLIFTENEAVYLCDDMYCQESIRRDIPTRPTGQGQGLAGEALSGISPMSINERRGRVEIDDLLNEYNSRDLRYQSDALNACQGILRGLSIPHNWGHPIMPLSWWNEDRRPHGSCTLNLYWKSDEPGIRRENFPSWSWVGWKGSKTFANYDHYFTDAATIEAKSVAGQWLGLEKCFDRRDRVLITAMSQRLRITGLVVQLAPYVVDETWIKTRMPGYQATHKGSYVVFPYSHNLDIVGTVHLDKKEADADILKDALGLLINQHRKRRYRSIMLLLKPNGDHYCRIGTLNCRNLGVFRNQRDFTQSKRILQEEDGCFWMKDFSQKTIEVE